MAKSDDLVSDLRVSYICDGDSYEELEMLMRRAADEIERLRAGVELHRPDHHQPPITSCLECGKWYPCPTVRPTLPCTEVES